MSLAGTQLCRQRSTPLRRKPCRHSKFCRCHLVLLLQCMSLTSKFHRRDCRIRHRNPCILLSCRRFVLHYNQPRTLQCRRRIALLCRKPCRHSKFCRCHLVLLLQCMSLTGTQLCRQRSAPLRRKPCRHSKFCRCHLVLLLQCTSLTCILFAQLSLEILQLRKLCIVLHHLPQKRNQQGKSRNSPSRRRRPIWL